MEGFREPDWDAPVDVSAHVDAVPDDATMRGFLTAAIVRRARRLGAALGRERYLSFRSYPLREHVEILATGAPLLFPGLPLRRALRELASLTLPTFRDTTAGRVLLSLSSGARGGQALRLVARGYGMSRSIGSARVLEAHADRAVVGLRGIHDFADSLHVGIFEHLIRDYGHSGIVRVRRLGPFDVDLELVLDRGLR